MAAVAIQQTSPIAEIDVGVTGTETVLAAANNTMVNDGKTLLLVRNTEAATNVVTLNFNPSFHNRVTTALAITLAVTGSAGDHVILGPFPVASFGTTLSFDCDSVLVSAQGIRT